MPFEAFQRFLIAAFPRETWPGLVSGLRGGVRLADAAIEATPLLRFRTGQDLRGHVRRVGVLFQIQESCRLGELPFKAEAAKMPIGSWHWLDIRAGRALAHVVRTDTGRAIPEITASRQAHLLKNQRDLFEASLPPVEEALSLADERYSALTFGVNRGGDLTHAGLGMPSSDGGEWLAFVDLLRAAGAEHEGVVAPAPLPPDASKQLKFLKHVEQLIAEDDESEKTA